MLKSLVLADPPEYFPQAMGPCYHYAPNTAALLYEVTPLYHRGTARPGASMAKSEALTALGLSGSIRVAAIAHEGAGTVNAGLYTANEHGEYEWQMRNEVPWQGMPTTAAILHVRYLPCPIQAWTSTLTTDTRIAKLDLAEFRVFLAGWLDKQSYYFPALRQAELATRGLLSAIQSAMASMPFLCVSSLPSFACYVTMREVGNARRPLPDLFDDAGNAVASRSRIDPESSVMRGTSRGRRHLPRATIVNELFTNGKDWDGTRQDDNPTNDRIENLVPHIDQVSHKLAYLDSQISSRWVFSYNKLLPKPLHFTRGWRYGIDYLAFDLDEKL